MALDTLVLGPFVFTDFATPEQMPYGGRQHTIVHKMPGGTRTIDCMGPDDDDRTWHGILWGDSAFGDMLLLDQLRRSGQALPFSWGAEFRTAVISDFRPHVQKITCIHYEIAIILDDDGEDSLFGSLDSLIGQDLSAALAA